MNKYYLVSLPYLFIGSMCILANKIGKDIFNAKVECNKLYLKDKY